MRFPIDEIWIDDDAADEALTSEIIRRIPAAEVISGADVQRRRRELDLDPDPLSRGKRILRLVRHKGAFVKPCPGTPNHVCCDLEILHIGQGCPMDCRYCALQVYFNRPAIEVFVNVDDLVASLARHLKTDSRPFHRICTGEFTDSLALDPLTGLAPRLVEFFARVENACLEIKTKTDAIEPLLDLDPRGRVVLSFSVNPREIADTEDRRAAPIGRRLAAAARGQKKGYRVGFHFDPIIPVQGWEVAYDRAVDEIFRTVDPSSVAWISLGVLRFAPQLKEAVRARFGSVSYFHDAFQRGLDGKCRLHADRRIGIYRRIADRIRDHSADARIYLCMESAHVWKEALGLAMDSDEALAAYLNAAVP